MKITVLESGRYKLEEDVIYYSERYKGTILAKAGIYDGATGAVDILSLAWVIHDQICNEPFFSDGRKITAWMAASILSDILKQEKRWFRSFTWKYMTFFLGCNKTRKNGWI